MVLAHAATTPSATSAPPWRLAPSPSTTLALCAGGAARHRGAGGRVGGVLHAGGACSPPGGGNQGRPWWPRRRRRRPRRYASRSSGLRWPRQARPPPRRPRRPHARQARTGALYVAQASQGDPESRLGRARRQPAPTATSTRMASGPIPTSTLLGCTATWSPSASWPSRHGLRARPLRRVGRQRLPRLRRGNGSAPPEPPSPCPGRASALLLGTVLMKPAPADRALAHGLAGLLRPRHRRAHRVALGTGGRARRRRLNPEPRAAGRGPLRSIRMLRTPIRQQRRRRPRRPRPGA